MNNLTFKEYLAIELVKGFMEGTERVFAINAITDRRFPKSAKLNAMGFYKVVDYMHNTFNDREAYAAFFNCWERYHEVVTGAPWGLPF